MGASNPGDPERFARLALGRLGEPGDPRLARMVARFGAEEVYQSLKQPARLPLDEDQTSSGMVEDVAARLAAVDPVAELATGRAQGFRFLVPGDSEWPPSLRDLDDAGVHKGRGGSPLGLWVRGPMSLAEAVDRCVAIVGCRASTTAGEENAGMLAAGAVQAGYSVVSGAAIGIDQAAHRAALAMRGTTVAVLACGIDRHYPLRHRALIDYIADTGVVVSETPLGGAPMKIRFLSRNRIIAALGQGTVVVEAGRRSGSLNTATWSELLNRPVMGVPGSINSAQSEGVHRLIRMRGAGLVTSPGDLMDVVSPIGEDLPEPLLAEPTPYDALSLAERQVLDAVPALRPAPLRNVVRTSGLAQARVAKILDRLGDLGLVDARDGWFRLPQNDRRPS